MAEENTERERESEGAVNGSDVGGNNSSSEEEAATMTITSEAEKNILLPPCNSQNSPCCRWSLFVRSAIRHAG